MTEKELLSYKGNWPEDFEFENGKYICGCYKCGHQFLGNRKRAICAICSQLSFDFQHCLATAPRDVQ